MAGFIASGKSGKIVSFLGNSWKVRESQGKSGKVKKFLEKVRESQGFFLAKY